MTRRIPSFAPFAGALLMAGTLPAAAAPQSTALTVYQQGAAVVAATRDLELQSGTQTLELSGIPEQIVPRTIWLQGEGVRLAGISHRAGSGREALLDDLVGQTITLLREDGAGGDVMQKATLLAVDGIPMVRVEEHIEWIGPDSPWRIALSEVPESALLDSRVALTLAAETAGSHLVEMVYQTNGLSWEAAYIGRLDGNTLALSARATIANASGGDWQNAEVALIAGGVNRAADHGPRVAYMVARGASAAAPEAKAPERAFEYYRYPLSAPLTLAAGETRSVPLFPVRKIEVERQYRFDGGWAYYGRGDSERSHAEIRISFENRFDMPLPAGTIRVYGDGAMLLGEDAIGNTPEGAPLHLTLGTAFDITAERSTTDIEREGKAREVARKIVVHNAKDQDVTVRIVESLPGDWNMLEQSAEHERLDAHRAAWSLAVPAKGKATLTYRVRYR